MKLDQIRTTTIEVAVAHHCSETYEYGGATGGVSQKVTDIEILDAADVFSTFSFDQSWTYDDLGSVATMNYPELVGNDAVLDDLLITSGYTNGWLTSVTPGVEEITYHPNGMLEFVKYRSESADQPVVGIAFDRDPD
ncbi:MAG: hypothetical protein K8R59_01580 [Thermoanaerobaculales bacterium]|nr:hypothetical protein [Thermoanaerobaculales bacterium]